VNFVFVKTILVNGVSKAYAMPGWRLGYAAAKSEIITGMCDLQGHMTTTTNSISQYAALKAITGSQECLKRMREEYNTRRQYLFTRLNNMPHISCIESKGAFFVLANVSQMFGMSYKGNTINYSKDVAEFILDAAHVAVVQGDAFHAPNYVRISYSNSLQAIAQAMDRMEAALIKLG
jgi:aspartate aminotransferase